MNQQQDPPKARRGFRSPWHELDYLCKRIHYWWYKRKVKSSAKRYLGRLERVLKELPKNDLAIDREEGLAWLYQLRGEDTLAIPHRQRETELMELAHKSVRHSLSIGRYGRSTARYILAGRGVGCLKERQAMLKALIAAESSGSAEKVKKRAK